LAGKNNPNTNKLKQQAMRSKLREKTQKAKAIKKGKGSPYSTAERRVPELIPVLGSQPAGYVSHESGGRLPLLSARPAVTPQPLRGLLPILLL